MTAPSLLETRLPEIHEALGALVSASSAHAMMDLALATVVSVRLSMSEETPLVWVLFVGPPSSGKTDVLLAFKLSPSVEFLDKPTPEMFSSGAYDTATKKQAKAYLPMLHGRCLVMQDLTTLFSMRQDKVKTILGDLNSIHNGEFTKGTGMALGDVKVSTTHHSEFTFVGAVTHEAVARHHRYMSQIGTRFLLYRVPKMTPAEIKAGYTLADKTDQKALRQTLRELVRDQIAGALAAPFVVSLSHSDNEWLQALSQLVAVGRTPVRWERIGDGRAEYDAVIGSPEGPHRSYKQLRTLLRALVLVSGRHEPTDADRDLIRRVALSSVLGDRAEVLEILGTGLTVEQCAKAIRRSDDAARVRLREMVDVGLLVEQKGVPVSLSSNLDGAGKPASLYVARSNFASLLITTNGNKP
jgi:hypothetical protein